jgi:serine/threonine protein kinase
LARAGCGTEADRVSALFELLLLESTYRRAAGETVTVEDYLSRFPEEPDAVQAALEEAERRPARARADRDFFVPRVLGEYEMLDQIGGGGMGVVYKARHRRLKKLIAVKVLRPGLTCNREAVERFDREIEAIGRLQHVNLVGAMDAREENGLRYLVMEYVEGRNLTEIVHARGRLGVADACEIVRQAALGLEHAHQRKLVHRDIKPSNLMLSVEGVVKVLDLGLARLEDAPAGRCVLTATGQALGTPDYMSPEQARGERNVDTGTDLYSLGATLYYLLAGCPPYGPPGYATYFAKLAAHREAPPPMIESVRGDVPGEVQRILRRLLAKDRAERFADPAELADALRPYCAGAHLPSLLAPAPPDARRHGPSLPETPG